MGNIACCRLQAANEEITLQQLRSALVGDSRQTKDRPEVWVTLKAVNFKVESSKIFPAKFHLPSVSVDMAVRYVASDAQIVQELGSEVALRLMDRVGVSASIKQRGSEFYGKVPKGHTPKPGTSSIIELKDRPAVRDGPDKVTGTAEGAHSWDQQESRSFDISVVATLSKELEEKEVVVEIDRLEATVNGHTSTLSSDVFRKHAATALSEKMTEILRRGVKG
mmetsp:Transcript_63371/g.182408  ORF Transcript_63371/g.182408 Transcript_63371/m.182408 type:complete len:222 (+) Transcript_63371:69-734(+)